jgi:hypothetical protein
VTEDERSHRVAAFLVQALALTDDPTAVARDLLLIDGDELVGIYAAEFETSVGSAAFLIYAYAFEPAAGDGESGRDRFAADLAALQTAATVGAPGPRLVAHAETDQAAYILATTPATMRALSGQSTTDPASATKNDVALTGDPLVARSAAATELLRLLRLAGDQARAWLLAVDATPQFEPTSEETELALHLLDDGSIQTLLQVMKRVIALAADRGLDRRGDVT